MSLSRRCFWQGGSPSIPPSSSSRSSSGSGCGVFRARSFPCPCWRLPRSSAIVFGRWLHLAIFLRGETQSCSSSDVAILYLGSYITESGVIKRLTGCESPTFLHQFRHAEVRILPPQNQSGVCVVI